MQDVVHPQYVIPTVCHPPKQTLGGIPVGFLCIQPEKEYLSPQKAAESFLVFWGSKQSQRNTSESDDLDPSAHSVLVFGAAQLIGCG